MVCSTQHSPNFSYANSNSTAPPPVSQTEQISMPEAGSNHRTRRHGGRTVNRSKLFRPESIHLIGQEISGNSTQKYYLVRINDIPLALPWTDFLILSVMGMRLQAKVDDGWTPWEMFTEDHHAAGQALYRLRQNIYSRLGRAGRPGKALLDWQVFQNRQGEGRYRLIAHNSKAGLVIRREQIEGVSEGDYRIEQCLKTILH